MRDDTQARRRRQRLVYRVVGEFLIDEAARLIQRHGGDFMRGAVYLAVAQGTRTDGGGAPRGVSIRATALSLSVPYETTRRHIAELEALGLCERLGDGGVTVAAREPDDAERLAREEAFDGIVALIGELKGLGYDFTGLGLRPGGGKSRAELAIAAAPIIEAFLLRTMEASTRLHGDVLNALLYSALLNANAEMITYDAALAWKYAGADTPPPDALRRPATVAQLARRLSLPHETVRRRMARFVERGWAARVRGGILSDMAHMQEPAISESGLVVTQRFDQMMLSLARIGLDIDAIAPRGRAMSA